MVFWILVVLVALAVVATFVYNLYEYEEFLFSLLLAFLVALLSGMVVIVLMLIALATIPADWALASRTEHRLAALHTSESVEGRSFFLGAGYVGGKRVLNYITVNDGAYRVEVADADRSVIYQDSEEPTVTIEEHEKSNWWIAPFPVATSTTYEFHVPDGSIIEQYEVR